MNGFISYENKRFSVACSGMAARPVGISAAPAGHRPQRFCISRLRGGSDRHGARREIAQVGARILMPEVRSALCILFLALAPLAGAGLALMNTGLGRSRNAAHTLMAALCVTATAAISYFVFGPAVQGFEGLPAYALNAGGRSWNWIGAEPLFFGGLSANGSPAFLAAWMG